MEVFGNESESMESAESWAACTKNTGHPNFIPYPELCMGHLPKEWQTQDYYDRVKTLANFTARLRVRYTSTERPEGYPFHNVRGTWLQHTGTGWIDPFLLRSDQRRFSVCQTHDGGTCPCPGCAKRGDQATGEHGVWYEVRVVTARHVVYDRAEAQETHLDFFYDSEKSEFNGEMQTIWGFDICNAHPESDYCVLRCATHNIDLLERLTQSATFIDTIPQSVVKPCGPGYVCVIVSHPHGRPKHVTVGDVLGFHINASYHQLSYTTSTCPGSSGARVLWVDGTVNGESLYLSHHIHSIGGGPGNVNKGFYYFEGLK